MRKLKIGIDVGGTFTHAVAIDLADFSLVGKVCVPTTHQAKEGVARGVIESLEKLMQATQIQPEEVTLIAHSTTQATNALLEGDVAVVGIIGMGKGLEGWRARQETRLEKILLAPGKYLPVRFQFIDLGKEQLSREKVQQVIRNLADQGAEVFVASEAFGVDRPENELFVANLAEELGFLATAASQISKLYGLRVRTRTAVINASMMPKMLETANMTEAAIKQSGLKAPLMVMRSDGGIMDIQEMRKRPIMTMLSGPAAGVAAALMHARISDGIFIEVGGTSSDISVIKNGKPQIKSAQIGENRLYVQTLDVRTLGIAGGSIPRLANGEIKDVGPRSAHIANLAYPSFSAEADFSGAKPEVFQPKKGDPADYLRFTRGEQNFTLTPTEAALYLNLTEHSAANPAAFQDAMQNIAQALGQTPEKLAESILKRSAEKIEPVIRQLLREYKLDAALVKFVGGGGGAGAIVPFAGKYLNIPYLIAEHAEVISAIGAALGMIRDSVERNIINPTDEDILRLRQEAFNSVVAMGATPESVEVSVEIDNTNKKVTAIAMGSSEMRTEQAGKKCLAEADLRAQAALSLRVPPDAVRLLAQTSGLFLFGAEVEQSRFLGLWKHQSLWVRVMEPEGTIRLQLNDCEWRHTPLPELKVTLNQVVEELTSFGDAGGLLPDIYILLGPRIIDLTGLMTLHQIWALTEIELQGLPSDLEAIVLAQVKR